MKFLISALVVSLIAVNCFGMSNEESAAKIKNTYTGMYKNIVSAQVIFINSQIKDKKKQICDQLKYREFFKSVDKSLNSVCVQDGATKMDITPIIKWEETVKKPLEKQIAVLENEVADLKSHKTAFEKYFGENESPKFGQALQRTIERSANKNESLKTTLGKESEDKNNEIENLKAQVDTLNLNAIQDKARCANLLRQRNYCAGGLFGTLAVVSGWFAYNHWNR